MRRIYYKVVKRNSVGELVSAVAYSTEWIKRYTPKRWMVPGNKKSLLFVFGTLHAAKGFMGTNSDFEVWRCEVKKSKIMRVLCNFLREYMYTTWWRDRELLTPFSESTAPMGTRGCKAVKLLERVV